MGANARRVFGSLIPIDLSREFLNSMSGAQATRRRPAGHKLFALPAKVTAKNKAFSQS
jgi:hypothetical protein